MPRVTKAELDQRDAEISKLKEKLEVRECAIHELEEENQALGQSAYEVDALIAQVEVNDYELETAHDIQEFYEKTLEAIFSYKGADPTIAERLAGIALEAVASVSCQCEECQCDSSCN